MTIAISALPAATLSTSSTLVLSDNDGSLANLVNAVGYAAEHQPAGTSITYTDSLLAVVGGVTKLIPVGDLPAQNIPVLFSSSVSGTFSASEILLNATCLATTILPENLTGSTFSFSGTATANASLNITNNGTIIGAVAVPAGSGTGTATLSTATTLSAGSVFEVLAPTAPDTTLAGASINIQASGLGQTNGVYLGTFASAPTSGIGGSALVAGDMYFNSALAELYEYTGSVWNVITTGSGISGVKITDGTNTVSSASTLVVSGGIISSTGSGSTVATLTVAPASMLAISQGTTSVGSVTSLAISGSGGTLTSSSAGSATLSISGGSSLTVQQGTTSVSSVNTLTISPTAGVLSGASNSATLSAPPVHLYASTTGTFTASQPLLRIPVLSQYIFASGLSGSVFKFGTAAAASASLLISNNGSTVGTITVPASSTLGTVNMSSSQTVATGNVFLISAPATPDTTLADADFGIIASR